VQLPSRFAFRPRERYRCPSRVPLRWMLVSIAEHIGAPIGATTWPLRVTATTHTAVGEIAVTIQRTSGSATADSGGTTDSLTRRGGHAEGEAHQHSGSLTWRVLLRPVAPMSALGQKAAEVPAVAWPCCGSRHWRLILRARLRDGARKHRLQRRFG
jgi:hypothetical protein